MTDPYYINFLLAAPRLVTASRESGEQSYTTHLWDTADGTLLHTTERPGMPGEGFMRAYAQ